ncbi:MAG: AAA family ATPase [Clostridiales bacterium]|jgi:DNA sulfur modification protein DndD|nr:AAA family ATPase [Clostridiales bacterium]
MTLHDLTIHNFRQYYGSQRLVFSKSASRNVTIILGENGEGKTALLNAIKWCFYGVNDLPFPERSLNERAEAELVDGGQAKISVAITFEDRQCVYTAIREELFRKSGKALIRVEHKFYLRYLDEAGAENEPFNAEYAIRSILPENMHAYFFFDGERIDALSKKEGTEGIKSAIKIILGLEVIERAIGCAGDACELFRKEFSDRNRNADTARLFQFLEQDRKLLANALERKETLDGAHLALTAQKEAVYQELKINEGAKELQAHRETLEAHIAALTKSIGDANADLRELISKSAYTAFCGRLAERFLSLTEKYEADGAGARAGDIPPHFYTAVRECLIERGQCICGAALHEGSPAYEAVKGFDAHALGRDAEERRGGRAGAGAGIGTGAEASWRAHVFSAMDGAARRKSAFLARAEALSLRKRQLIETRGEAIEELDAVAGKLDAQASKNIRELEARRKKIEEELNDTLKKQTYVELDIRQARETFEKHEKEFDRAQANNAKAELAKKRLEAAQTLQKALEGYLADSTRVVHQTLNESITAVYGNFSKKGYFAFIDENFRLTVVKTSDEAGRDVPMSQGERQIASLCFIGALVKIAREIVSKDQLFFHGGVFPIVMDSPFGALDHDHKERVGQGMPQLAEQVVLLISRTQWAGEVARTLATRVGKRYKLVNHNAKNDPEAKYEYTEIVEYPMPEGGPHIPASEGGA